MGKWWRWALVSPDGVAPSRMVSVSASVNLPLHHNVQKFTSGTGSPSWSQKKGCKTVLVWCCGMVYQYGDGVSKTVEKISCLFPNLSSFSCCLQGYVSSETMRQQNPPVLNWGGG